MYTSILVWQQVVQAKTTIRTGYDTDTHEMIREEMKWNLVIML